MKVRILTFAQSRLQLGFGEKIVECHSGETPRQIIQRIAPEFSPDASIRVAINQEYAHWDQPVGEAFELALIPPVSGG